MTPPSNAASKRSRPRGIVHVRPKNLVLVLVRFWRTKMSTRMSSRRLNPSAHQTTPVRVTGSRGDGTSDRAGSSCAALGASGNPESRGSPGGGLVLSVTSQ
jgi:hypothetical protein